MPNNIVIFGPEHDGKSTLFGYMITRHLDDEAFRIEEERIRRHVLDVGGFYDDSFRFAYFSDDAIDEIKRLDNNMSTTKNIRYKRMNFVDSPLSDVMLIDTPGIFKKRVNQFKNIYLARIGIYLIEYKKLKYMTDINLSSDEYRENAERCFAPIRIWTYQNDIKNLIAAVSKTDMYPENFTKFFFNKVNTLIKRELASNDVCVIPISINVSKRQDSNVFSEDMKNICNGPSLVAKIQDLLDKVEKSDKNKPFFAFVDEKFKRTKDFKNAAMRIKVLRGIVNHNDEIIMAPIKYLGKLHYATARAYSIKEEDGLNTSFLGTEQIGGIKVDRIFLDDGTEINEKVLLKSQNTLFIADTGTRFKYGQIMRVKILLTDNVVEQGNLKTINIIKEIVIRDSLHIIFFGKIINVSVVGKVMKPDYCDLYLHITNQDYIYLPIDDNNDFLYDKFVVIKNFYHVERVKNINKKPILYLNSKLRSLGVVYNSSVNKNSIEISTVFSDLANEIKKSFRSSTVEDMNDRKILRIPVSLDNLTDVTKKMKEIMMNCNYGLDSADTVIKINYLSKDNIVNRVKHRK